MKNLLVLIFMFILLPGCKSAGKFFNRPKIDQCITLAEPGLMACNGIKLNIPSGLVIAKTFADYEIIRKYYADKEQRLMICLKYRKNCK